MTAPPKHKPREDWSVEDHFQHTRTGVEPISDEWRSYVADVAEAAGVTPQDLGADPDDVRPEDMTVAQHHERIRRHRD